MSKKDRENAVLKNRSFMSAHYRTRDNLARKPFQGGGKSSLKMRPLDVATVCIVFILIGYRKHVDSARKELLE